MTYPKESIKKMAEVSTGHLEQNDAKLLERFAEQQMGYPGIVADYEEGFFVTVPLDPANQKSLPREGQAGSSIESPTDPY